MCCCCGSVLLISTTITRPAPFYAFFKLMIEDCLLLVVKSWLVNLQYHVSFCYSDTMGWWNKLHSGSTSSSAAAKFVPDPYMFESYASHVKICFHSCDACMLLSWYTRTVPILLSKGTSCISTLDLIFVGCALNSTGLEYSDSVNSLDSGVCFLNNVSNSAWNKSLRQPENKD